MKAPAFVSYAREDSSVALRLAADLKQAGANVWLDQLDIRPGRQWDREVEQALNVCQELLVILSPAAIASANVIDEVYYALDAGKNVIPLLIQDCQIPLRLHRVQYVDFRSNYREALKDLLAALAAANRREAAAAAEAGEPTQTLTAPAGQSPEPHAQQPPAEQIKEGEAERIGREEPEKKPGGTRMSFAKWVLAVLGLIAAGYFGLKYFYPPEPEILAFQAIPASTEAGKPVTLSWQTRNATRVELAGVGQVALTGRHTLSPRDTNDYTLTAENSRGRSVRTIRIAILAPSENWVRVVHNGGNYQAKFYVTCEGKMWASGERRHGYEEKVILPCRAETVLLNAQWRTIILKIGDLETYGPWQVVVRMDKAPVRRTYTVTGTAARPTLSISDESSAHPLRRSP